MKHNKSTTVFPFLFFLLLMSCLGVKVTTSKVQTQKEKIQHILLKEAKGWDKASLDEIASLVTRLSAAYHIDPILVLAIIRVESHFKPEARSHRGAVGLMQVKPIVVRDVAEQMGIPKQAHDGLLTNKEYNIRVGIHYLSKLLLRFKGDISKSLMAYNAGPTFVARRYAGSAVPFSGYQEKVLKTYLSYAGS